MPSVMICLCAPLEAKEKNSLNGSPSLITFSWKKDQLSKVYIYS